MTEKEFNLSEKKIKVGDYHDGMVVYPEKHVKEFIRRLKDKFEHDTYWQKVCFNIDKLAGNKSPEGEE